MLSSAYGLPNYNPPRPIGEDDISMKHHKRFLSDQARLKVHKRDGGKIVDRMSLTFADSRQLILGGATVQEISEEFPLLLDVKEVRTFLHSQPIETLTIRKCVRINVLRKLQYNP